MSAYELFTIPERGYMSNVYILSFPALCLIVDPSQLLSAHPALKEEGKALQLWATHGHFDHVAAADRLRLSRPGTALRAHEAEQRLLADPLLNGSRLFGENRAFAPAERPLRDGEVLALDAGYRFRVIHTPGHTRGSVCYLLEDAAGKPELLFSGDTLFRGSVGRSDLPTGDPLTLEGSLEKLVRAARSWPAELPIYPGHGPETRMDEELRHNPWLCGKL